MGLRAVQTVTKIQKRLHAGAGTGLQGFRVEVLGLRASDFIEFVGFRV